jgi:hypothetical protein
MMTASGRGEPATAARTLPRRVWPVDPAQHTMAAGRLFRYLQIKVHHLIQEHDWPAILVVGEYDRQCVISANEKNDKLFNWQRPTAEDRDGCLVIKCFPGADYVRHYALIIATYLAMLDRYRGQVSYRLPSEQECQEAIRRLDVDPSADDLVITGWGLSHLALGASWARGHGYAWHRARIEGHRVLYLGYLHSIWGDTAGRVVTQLARQGARRVVYVGKVGSLDPAITPNTCLASGSASIIFGCRVTWQDFFGDSTARQPDVRRGVHVTSPSVLLEDRTWLASQAGNQFVDPEIGHMGQAARTAGIEFGYLHAISNNLAWAYPDDLSNERCSTVLQRRAELLDRIRQIIQLRLQTASPVPAEEEEEEEEEVEP